MIVETYQQPGCLQKKYFCPKLKKELTVGWFFKFTLSLSRHEFSVSFIEVVASLQMDAKSECFTEGVPLAPISFLTQL